MISAKPSSVLGSTITWLVLIKLGRRGCETGA
jgi:hypothetical protein